MPVNFNNIDDKYTNQTLIQVTENDVGIGFGLITFDDKGNDTVDLHTMMRMSLRWCSRYDRRSWLD